MKKIVVKCLFLIVKTTVKILFSPIIIASYVKSIPIVIAFNEERICDEEIFLIIKIF